jgi:DNA topoisomerase-2
MKKTVGSDYVKSERRSYALYTLENRAIPSISDGLKAAARRVLWTARDGKKWKSAALSGATMPIHPHAAPDGAINTLAAPWGNNVLLLEPHGAFGTKLDPTSYGASRYTATKVSKFTQDVMFADIEIIPMIPNYDDTLEEPKHFLPLVPMVLVNPQEGIAVGFSCNFLPRSLGHVIADQLKYLNGEKVEDRPPRFDPYDAVGEKVIDGKWLFKGDFETQNTTTIKITKLPYGLSHEKFYERLMAMEENGKIPDFKDNSKNDIDITVRVRRSDIDAYDRDDVTKFFGLTTTLTENNTLLDFDGKRVLNLTYSEIIAAFCDWRLGWFRVRYERLLRLLNEDIQKYRDIILAIDKDVGGAARKFESRGDLKVHLEKIGIVNLDYIADFPVYRFTKGEREKVAKRLEEALKLAADYEDMLAKPGRQRNQFITELKDIAKKYA